MLRRETNRWIFHSISCWFKIVIYYHMFCGELDSSGKQLEVKYRYEVKLFIYRTFVRYYNKSMKIGKDCESENDDHIN